MNIKFNLTKVFAIAGIVFALSLINPQKIFSACSNGTSRGPDPSVSMADETCTTTPNGLSSFGNAVYSCANYPFIGQACYYHDYYCDSPCSGSGPPTGGGGGGGSCPWTQVNCGSGTAIDLTQPIGAVFNAQVAYCPLPGTAQRIVSVGGTTCASGYWIAGECEDVWRPAYNRWVEECEPDEYVCRSRYMRRYACISTTPTCTVGLLPATSTVSVGAVVPLTAVVPPSGNPPIVGTVQRVDFSLVSGSAIINPPSDNPPPSYQTDVTPTTTSVIRADVIMGGVSRCFSTATITVTNTQAWWQVKDGDITAENGDIMSSVPSGQLFNTNGLGGFPGVPVYSGALSVGSGSISSTNWNADTVTSQGRIFDYSYFENLIPDDIIPTTNSALLTSSGFVGDGYEWFKITGDLSINAINGSV